MESAECIPVSASTLLSIHARVHTFLFTPRECPQPSPYEAGISRTGAILKAFMNVGYIGGYDDLCLLSAGASASAATA
jgi:hypothetical protein